MPTSSAPNRIQRLIERTDFVIIGHRGAAGLAPENTLQSFACALDWDCPMLELDVYACTTGDGNKNLLVIHDDKLNRTTNGSGRVMDQTVEQLRQLDAGNGQQIPLLQEVAELIREHKQKSGSDTALNIELKGPGTAAPTAAALHELQDIAVLVSSFDHAQLRQFHELAPQCPIAPLYDRYRDAWRTTARDMSAVAINLSGRISSAARVQAMREAGYAVFVYTVNAIEDARVLRARGVNGVFTDRPDLLMPMLDDDAPRG